MQTDSELESDTSSINDGVPGGMASASSTLAGGPLITTAIGVSGGAQSLAGVPMSKESYDKRIESLMQENRVLKMEIETFKLRVKSLQEENFMLRKASVNIQARAEQEEEYISNKLLKKIQSLKKEKEALANNYEREEEYLTNDLSRKLNQLRNEKVQLEQTLEQEQEHMVNKLMRKIEKLEAETSAKQSNLEQLRREKIELENTLEQEQESLVNRLWKRMERLEAEKRILQEKLDQPVSAPMSPRNLVSFASSSSSSLSSNNNINNNNNPPGSMMIMTTQQQLQQQQQQTGTTPTNNPLIFPASSEQAVNLTEHIINLRREVSRLKANLEKAERDHKENMAKLAREEKLIRDENVRLQRRLQMEVDRREALCRHLSESESSLEMDDERHFNETSRVRTVSSPVPGYLMQSNPSLNTQPVVTSNSANTSVVSASNPSNANTSNSNAFPVPVLNQLHSSAAAAVANLISPLQSTTQSSSERCPTCNQIRVCSTTTGFVLQKPAQTVVASSTSTTFSTVNPLTASSSLSSSSSSINSSTKTQHQLQSNTSFGDKK